MDDRDVTRLEDRIAASEQRGELRLEAAMAKVDSALIRLYDQNVALTTQIQSLASQIQLVKQANSTWSQWIIGTILVVALAFAGLAVGLKQIWVSGVQVGQTIQTAAPASTPLKPN